MTLTPEQLTSNAAAMIAFRDEQAVQARKRNSGQSWTVVCHPGWNFYLYEFRPKPLPSTRPWSKPEDVPLGCWVRYKDNQFSSLWAVTGINYGAVWSAEKLWTWPELELMEHSTDRKTWNPCVVEVEG